MDTVIVQYSHQHSVLLHAQSVFFRECDRIKLYVRAEKWLHCKFTKHFVIFASWEIESQLFLIAILECISRNYSLQISC
jgi:hypothetical protein